MKQMQKALEKVGLNNVPPRHRMILLERGKMTLGDLLTHGFVSPALGKDAGDSHVLFEQIGRPFHPRHGTGWKSVKVRSNFGAITSLLLEGGSGVSGLLKLRRGRA